MEPDLEKAVRETNSKEWTHVEVVRNPLISCQVVTGMATLMAVQAREDITRPGEQILGFL